MLNKRRILGIDPGTLTAGFAFLEQDLLGHYSPNNFKVLEAGVLKMAPKYSVWQRLSIAYKNMAVLVEEFEPSVCVLESVFMHHNFRSALRLGEARGAFIASVANQNIPIHEMAPTKVKKLIVGKGHASKEEVCKSVEALLLFKRGKLPFDVSDAVAIALSYGLSQTQLS